MRDEGNKEKKIEMKSERSEEKKKSRYFYNTFFSLKNCTLSISRFFFLGMYAGMIIEAKVM